MDYTTANCWIEGPYTYPLRRVDVTTLRELCWYDKDSEQYILPRGTPLRVVGVDERGKEKLGRIDAPDQYLRGLVYEPTVVNPANNNTMVRVASVGGVVLSHVEKTLRRSLTDHERSAFLRDSDINVHPE